MTRPLPDSPGKGDEALSLLGSDTTARLREPEADKYKARSSGSVRPILFSAPMVRALLAGSKTQTRRIVKPQPVSVGFAPLVSFNHGIPEISFGPNDRDARGLRWWRCPYGQPGDRLWVREAWTCVPATAYRQSVDVHQTVNPTDSYDAAIYAAGWDRSIPKWKPSIHMPRWASRVWLTVTDIRVQRLCEISGNDAEAEGLKWIVPGVWSVDAVNVPVAHADPKIAYMQLWDHINGEGSAGLNPWVWAVTFTVHRGNVDADASRPVGGLEFGNATAGAETK